MKVRGGQKGLDLISVVQATKGDNAKNGGGRKDRFAHYVSVLYSRH